MKDLISTTIESFNLSEKEARVYLASLELGRATASDIAKKAELNRVTTYEILKRLILRGLASAINLEKVRYFQVIDPDKFLEKMDRQLSMAKEHLPELHLIKGSNRKNKPRVEFYEGIEGLRLIYDDTVNCEEKILYNIANPVDLIPFMGQEFISNYIKRRKKRRVKINLLLPDIDKNRHYKEMDKVEFRETRFLDNKNLQIPNEIIIYDNKVALLSFSGRIGVIVEDADISQSLKTIWKMLWDSSILRTKQD